MVASAKHGTGKAGAQMRLEAADLGWRQPFEVEAEAPLELVSEAKLIEVVAGQRDDDRTLVPVFDRDPGSRLEFARELRPQTLAFERQREQCFLAGLGFDCGGEHAGSRPAGAAPGLAAFVNADLATRF